MMRANAPSEMSQARTEAESGPEDSCGAVAAPPPPLGPWSSNCRIARKARIRTIQSRTGLGISPARRRRDPGRYFLSSERSPTLLPSPLSRAPRAPRPSVAHAGSQLPHGLERYHGGPIRDDLE